MTLTTRIAPAFCVLLSPLAALADNAAPQERYLFELLRAGGWTMVPLGLCLLAVLYLVVYCWRETAPRRFFSQTHGSGQADNNDQTHGSGQTDDSKQTHNRSQNGKATHADAKHTPNETLFTRALKRGLAKTSGKTPLAARTAAENAIGETLSHAEAETLRWIGYLNIIAAIAPMIGLLGTVSGMIGAFGTISVGGMGRPEMLAGNIGEALVSTATGLAVGIPAMLCYHVLHNRLGLRMNETVSRLNDALDARLGGE